MCEQYLTGHVAAVRCVQLDLDGGRVISGAYDFTIKVGSFVDVGTSTSGIEAVACVALLFRSMLVQSAYHLKTISLIFGTKTQNSE
ncbi:hypothetical protein Y032_0773g2237 [Ancylostoma ceylanicum]|uniref:Uncharacterized protein n=1 Tax=Ancylostoma ceylanicum TaxID=53326 RepID=A0A016WCX1_9BILA|nr:hypothetical protein Y032_0773g2237 [Ancylostoma ceylanicum]